MSAYYPQSCQRYFSKLDPHSDFKTAALARAFDRDLVVKAIAQLDEDGLIAMFESGDSSLVACLRFAADEIEDAARDVVIPYSAETP